MGQAGEKRGVPEQGGPRGEGETFVVRPRLPTRVPRLAPVPRLPLTSSRFRRRPPRLPRSSALSLHPRVLAAARGELPPWARADRKRVAHMERVAELLAEWADAAGLEGEERDRQVALGFLHDAVKGLPAAELRDLVDPGLRELPDPVLHGPAAAALLARDGVQDPGLLHAVSYHTLGHPHLDAAGRCLYAADFLEPGRNLRNKWRARLRSRMPHQREKVVREILRARIEHLLDRRRPVRPETMAFWNSLVGGPAWARASEV